MSTKEFTVHLLTAEAMGTEEWHRVWCVVAALLDIRDEANARCARMEPHPLRDFMRLPLDVRRAVSELVMFYERHGRDARGNRKLDDEEKHATSG